MLVAISNREPLAVNGANRYTPLIFSLSRKLGDRISDGAFVIGFARLRNARLFHNETRLIIQIDAYIIHFGDIFAESVECGNNHLIAKSFIN